MLVERVLQRLDARDDERRERRPQRRGHELAERLPRSVHLPLGAAHSGLPARRRRRRARAAPGGQLVLAVEVVAVFVLGRVPRS